ncbi:MAG: hypothetical protein QM770_15395 [Tepidisphaeraceae bacterium]
MAARLRATARRSKRPAKPAVATANERATVLFTLAGVLTIGSTLLILLAPAPLRSTNPRVLTATHDAQPASLTLPDDDASHVSR